MGNHHSSRQLVDVALVSQSHDAVVLQEASSARVLSTATKLRLEHQNNALSVFDHATGELFFRHDEQSFSEWTESMLVDAKSSPVVKLTKKIAYSSSVFLIHIPDEPHKELCKIETRKHDFTVMLKLKLTDAKSGEKLLIEVDSDWRLCKGVVWLSRGAAADRRRKAREEVREAISVIAYRENGYDVEVAAGVDLTIAALMSIILDDTMKWVPSYNLGVLF